MDDIHVWYNPLSGMITVSAMDGGVRMSRRYLDYSEEDAVRDFTEQLNNAKRQNNS